MSQTSDIQRGYMRLSKFYYVKRSPTLSRETVKVMVGLYHKEGGCLNEFMFEWDEIGLKLEAYQCSFQVLSQFKDLIDKMAEIETINEPEFCRILDSLGVIDMTEYEQEGVIDPRKFPVSKVIFF